MKKFLALIFALAFTRSATSLETGTHTKDKVLLVHFVAINMSGAARLVLHGRDVITLPVAVRVPLQIPIGESIEIISPTNQKIKEAIAIAATDEGRTIPIH